MSNLIDANEEEVGVALLLKCFLTAEATPELDEFLSFLKVDLSTLTFQPEQHESSQSAPIHEKVDINLNVLADWLAIEIDLIYEC
jgi:hypothetical protein